MPPDYSLAFLTGLLGGFGHCLGMCGPVVAAFALHGGGRIGAVPHLLYNAGRIVTYTFVGSLMGLGGSFVNTAGALAGAQSAVPIVAGAAMVMMGLDITGAFSFTRRIEGRGAAFFRAAAPILESSSPLKFFPLGLVLGFLPCGLSYSIFIGAAATGDMVRGFLFAFSFGIATVPALFLFGTLMNVVSARARGVIYRLGGVAVIATGLLFIKRGIASYAAL
jgi:hypothetical protein